MGRLIKGRRSELVITSKFGYHMGPGRNDTGGSRRHMMASIEGSLKRLQTDYIDIYFIHRFDPNTPIEATLHAFDDLVTQGKIRYPAVSNYAAWQIAKALGISARNSWARFECIQPMYNLVKRQAEVEILPLAESENMGVIPYSPLGAGLLTGKYGVSRRPEGGRLTESETYTKRYAEGWQYETAERFTAFAHERGFEPAALAVRWVANHPAVTSAIIGARTLAQLEGSLKMVDITMTPELRAEISALSPAPAVATDRAEELVG